MDYLLESASKIDIDRLINYKLNNIFDYAKNLEQEEIDKINNYVKNNIPKQLNDYKLIKIGKEIIGCLLVEKYQEGVLLDEIYLEELYRDRGIGTHIIKEVLNNNEKVYLWVYKDNLKAFNLYKKLGFIIKEETENRYFMEYMEKLEKARKFCKEVSELAKKYNLPFFVVTDGASAISNNGCEAVKNARENHIKWELKNNFDPNEDWSQE